MYIELRAHSMGVDGSEFDIDKWSNLISIFTLNVTERGKQMIILTLLLATCACARELYLQLNTRW